MAQQWKDPNIDNLCYHCFGTYKNGQTSEYDALQKTFLNKLISNNICNKANGIGDQIFSQSLLDSINQSFMAVQEKEIQMFSQFKSETEKDKYTRIDLSNKNAKSLYDKYKRQITTAYKDYINDLQTSTSKRDIFCLYKCMLKLTGTNQYLLTYPLGIQDALNAEDLSIERLNTYLSSKAEGQFTSMSNFYKSNEAVQIKSINRTANENITRRGVDNNSQIKTERVTLCGPVIQSFYENLSIIQEQYTLFEKKRQELDKNIQEEIDEIINDPTIKSIYQEYGDNSTTNKINNIKIPANAKNSNFMKNVYIPKYNYNGKKSSDTGLVYNTVCNLLKNKDKDLPSIEYQSKGDFYSIKNCKDCKPENNNVSKILEENKANTLKNSLNFLDAMEIQECSINFSKHFEMWNTINQKLQEITKSNATNSKGYKYKIDQQLKKAWQELDTKQSIVKINENVSVDSEDFYKWCKTISINNPQNPSVVYSVDSFRRSVFGKINSAVRDKGLEFQDVKGVNSYFKSLSESQDQKDKDELSKYVKIYKEAFMKLFNYYYCSLLQYGEYYNKNVKGYFATALNEIFSEQNFTAVANNFISGDQLTQGFLGELYTQLWSDYILPNEQNSGVKHIAVNTGGMVDVDNKQQTNYDTLIIYVENNANGGEFKGTAGIQTKNPYRHSANETYTPYDNEYSLKQDSYKQIISYTKDKDNEKGARYAYALNFVLNNADLFDFNSQKTLLETSLYQFYGNFMRLGEQEIKLIVDQNNRTVNAGVQSQNVLCMIGNSAILPVSSIYLDLYQYVDGVNTYQNDQSKMANIPHPFQVSIKVNTDKIQHNPCDYSWNLVQVDNSVGSIRTKVKWPKWSNLLLQE